MAHHTHPAPMAQALIPSDPDVGRLATVRPQAVERVRQQMTHGLQPLTVDRLLAAVGIEPPIPRFMTFDTGPWIYTIYISAEKLFTHDGFPAAGLQLWGGRKLIVAPDVPRKQRLEVLLHEAWHAWRVTHGQSLDEEVIADQVPAFFFSFMAQFQSQGGEPALMAMEPADPDDLIEHPERWDTSAC